MGFLWLLKYESKPCPKDFRDCENYSLLAAWFCVQIVNFLPDGYVFVPFSSSGVFNLFHLWFALIKAGIQVGQKLSGLQIESLGSIPEND